MPETIKITTKWVGTHGREYNSGDITKQIGYSGDTMSRWYSASRQCICYTIIQDLRQIQDKYQVQRIMNDVSRCIFTKIAEGGNKARQFRVVHMPFFPEEEASFVEAFLDSFSKMNGSQKQMLMEL